MAPLQHVMEPLYLYPDLETGCEGSHCMPVPMQRDVTDVPVEELHPCMACCCGFASLFFGCPSCCGISGQTTCICCMSKYVCCKLLDCKDEDSKCCACCQGNLFLTFPNKCCENQAQCFCVDTRYAFPPTNKVPCAVNFLGVYCCADYGCKCVGTPPCRRLGDVIPRLDDRAGKSPSSASNQGQTVQVTVNVQK